MQFNTYLTFNGQCEAAFKFYEQCLGGKIDCMLTHAQAPPEFQTSPEWRDKILHARMTMGDSILMGSDAPAGRYQEPAGISVHLGLADPEDAERIFNQLSVNGKVQMPLQQTFWARKFGMVSDQFGTPWMVNCQ